MTSQSARPERAHVQPLFPQLCMATLVTVLLGGLFSLGAWEVWARVLAPFWVGGPLEPTGLIRAVFGFQNAALVMAIHVMVGLVFYPLGYVFVARPVARAVLPGLPWPVVAFGYGVALWVFALYVMAHLFAGMPPFLGFIQISWASLVGHVILGLVLGLIVRLREE
jgi:hypothetical protein